MPWYLNRGGPAEGPLEEQAIVQMIQSGQLREGYVCVVGSDQWMPLAAHPPFAQALAAPAAPAGMPGASSPDLGPGAMGPGAMGPGMGPGAMGPGPTVPGGPMGPGAMGPGGPMGPGYGPPPGVGGAPVQATAPGEKAATAVAVAGAVGSRVIILGGVAGALVLGVVVWLLATFVVSCGGPKLAKAVPKDVQVYFEIPNVKKALVGFRGQDYIDTDELDEKKIVEDTVKAFSKAFDVDEDEAEDILMGVDGLSISARNLDKRGEGAMLIKFGSNSDIEKLVGAKRFKEDGTVGGEARYTLKRREIEYEKLKDASAQEKAFSEWSLSGEKKGIVWIKDHKILAVGENDYIAECIKVLEGDKDSLASTDGWKDSKFEGGQHAYLWIDTRLAADGPKDVKKLADGYLKDVGGIVLSAKFVDAGMLVSARGKLSGSMVPKEELSPKKASLDLYKRVPEETVAYIAMATELDAEGKEVQKEMLKSIDKSVPEGSKQIEKGIDEIEKGLGVKVADLFDMFGEQAIFAVAVSKDYKLSPGTIEDDLSKHFGAVYIQELRNKDAKETAEKLVKQLKTKVFEGLATGQYKVSGDGEGFKAEPTGPKLPYVRVVFEDDHLLIMAGSKNMNERFVEAFTDKTDTLKKDDAHGEAIDAFSGKPGMIMWFDTGRIAEAALKLEPKADEMVKKELGISLKAFKLSGEERITSAIAMTIKHKGDDEMEYVVESLNAVPLFAGIGAASLFRMKRAFEQIDDDMGKPSPGFPAPAPAPAPAVGGSGGGGIGVPECDDYLKKMDSCILKMPAASQTPMRDAMKQTRESWEKMGQNPATKSALASACKSAMDAIKQNPMCN